MEICSTKSIGETITSIYIKECPSFSSASDEMKDTLVLDGHLTKIPENLWDDRTLLDYNYEFIHVAYNKKEHAVFCKYMHPCDDSYDIYSFLDFPYYLLSKLQGWSQGLKLQHTSTKQIERWKMQ